MLKIKVGKISLSVTVDGETRRIELPAREVEIEFAGKQRSYPRHAIAALQKLAGDRGVISWHWKDNPPVGFYLNDTFLNRSQFRAAMILKGEARDGQR